MNILSIDASTKSSGIAVFNNKELVYYDCITSTSKDLIKRIFIMIEGLGKILSKYDIDKIIIEEVRPEYGKKIQTYRALMWLQAAINFFIYVNYKNIEIEYVYPSSWRAKCGIHTGRGIKRNSLKEADIAFVKEKYNIDVNDDIADAICIGHAYVNDLKEPEDLNWG